MKLDPRDPLSRLEDVLDSDMPFPYHAHMSLHSELPTHTSWVRADQDQLLYVVAGRQRVVITPPHEAGKMYLEELPPVDADSAKVLNFVLSNWSMPDSDDEIDQPIDQREETVYPESELEIEVYPESELEINLDSDSDSDSDVDSVLEIDIDEID